MTDRARGSNEQALNEEFAQFSVGGQRVYGMLHRPTGEAPAHGWPSVILLHGFTGSRTSDHRLFPLLSRYLAARGVASLRFDFRGSGESHGDFSEMTVTREVEDTLAAFDYVRRQPGLDPQRVMLLGFSMGGLVAAQSATQARVFHGDQDRTCPPEYGVRYAQALHCDAIAIPGAGHTFDNLEQVALLFRETTRFLTGG